MANITVTVGGHSQTTHLLAGSLQMRYNSFDFTLKAPTNIPALGEAVAVTHPTWAGDVVSVTFTQPQAGPADVILLVKVTCTNADVAEASAAPFGLSDTPNHATTFSYRDLTYTQTHNSTGDVTQGSLTTYHTGIWPAMTFELTSANYGLAAKSFTAVDVAVTWPRIDAPQWQISFGDPIVTMSVWLATPQAGILPIDHTKITDGEVWTPALAANCVTALNIDTEAIDFRTLAPSAHDVIQAHIPNNSFVTSTPGVLTMGANKDDAAGVNSSNPYWTSWHAGGSGFITVAVDTAYPGHSMGFAFSAGGSGNDVCLTTDKVPVMPGYPVAGGRLVGANVPAGVVVFATCAYDFYRADGTWISQTTGGAGTYPAGDYTAAIGTMNVAIAPVNARWCRLTYRAYEYTGHDAATRIHLGALRLVILHDQAYSLAVQHLLSAENLVLTGAASTTDGEFGYDGTAKIVYVGDGSAAIPLGVHTVAMPTALYQHASDIRYYTVSQATAFEIVVPSDHNIEILSVTVAMLDVSANNNPMCWQWAGYDGAGNLKAYGSDLNMGRGIWNVASSAGCPFALAAGDLFAVSIVRVASAAAVYIHATITFRYTS